MKRIIAVANQKGGVGKTTTTLNLGTALAHSGFKTLLIDFDPQANLSEYLQYTPDSDPTISDLMAITAAGRINNEIIRASIRHNETNGVDYIPVDISLAQTEQRIITALSRETILKRILSSEEFSEYHYILIDCLPSLGILLINALTASTDVIIPTQTQKFSADGLKSLTDVINQVTETLNPELKLCGILPTMVDNTNTSRATLERFKDDYDDKVFQVVIHKSVEAVKSSEKGKALCLSKNKLGSEYISLAKEISEG